MSKEVLILISTAASLGFIHTILGPDHYLPFIVLAKARNWRNATTFLVTFLCGLGHILSSIVLGFVGIALGTAVFRLVAIESIRGEVAVWMLIIFGFTYFIWGMHRAMRSRPHEHLDDHTHLSSHGVTSWASLTPWVLFIIFVFGPCEPLIPLIMYPAARHNLAAVVMVAAVFGGTTILTMLAIVMASAYGLSKLPLKNLERYSHALAGLALFLCGGAMKLFGL